MSTIDYFGMADGIAMTVAKVAAPLTNEQFLALAGALGVYVEKAISSQPHGLPNLPARPGPRSAGDWTVPEAEAIRAYGRACATHASPAPVPDEQAGDWQWVPRWPTESMMAAPARDRAGFSHGVACEVYRAMLAASPSRPVAAEKREPLTPERILELRGKCIVDGDDTSVGFCRLIEAEHGIGTHNATGGDGA